MIEPTLYKQIFEDDKRGAAILHELVTMFAKPHVEVGGIDAVLQTYTRAGNRQVLDFILRRVNAANGAPDPNADPGNDQQQ